MNTSKVGRIKALGLLALPLLALAVVVVVLSWGHSTSQPTEATGTGAMELAVKSGDKTCIDPGDPNDVCVEAGTDFTLSVEVTEPPAGGYTELLTYVEYDGLVYTQKADVLDELVWPDCDPALAVRGMAGTHVHHVCFTAFLPPELKSNFVGNVVELNMSCPDGDAKYTVDLLPEGDPQVGTDGTRFREYGTTKRVPASDSLTIHCQNSPLDLDYTAAYSEFIIPGVFGARLAEEFPAAMQGPVAITLDVDDVTTIFPDSGELLIGKTELVVYDLVSCGAIGPNDVCVTQRAKVGGKKQHEIGTKVKLATQLTDPILEDAATVAQTTLAAPISATAGGCTAGEYPGNAKCPDGGYSIAPFLITIADDTNFPPSGDITISHQEVQTANMWEMGPQGNATEYMHYDNIGADCDPAPGPNQLCITRRSQQSNNQAYSHSADGFPQPGHQTGRSIVDLHVQIEVKSNEGFFPSGNLIVYNVDETNSIVDAELMNYNNSAPKIGIPSATQFHMTSRGAPASTFKKTAIVQHKAGSIVTGPDTYVVCRNGYEQPGVDTDLITPGYQEPAQQVPGTSVGIVAVCYSESQPNGPPKTSDPKQLLVPIQGSDLLASGLAWIPGQPFLSTGGFCHVLLGAVDWDDSTAPDCSNPFSPVNTEPMDTDGTSGDAKDLDGDGDTTDTVLGLVSPCVLDYTPGTNLQVRIVLDVDKSFATPDTGTINVVLDAIHDDNATGDPADDCDDPAGTDDITVTTYIYPGDPDPSDDDTDGDGCSDVEELGSYQNSGGLRDPWNPYDYFDVNGDKYVSLFGDILEVISAYTAGGGTYSAAKDRGPLLYGPFGWNRSQPDGNIDLFNDILGVIGQYGHDCRRAP